MLSEKQKAVLSQIGMLDYPDIEGIVRYAGEDITPFISYLQELKERQGKPRAMSAREYFCPQERMYRFAPGTQAVVCAGKICRYRFKQDDLIIGDGFYINDGHLFELPDTAYLMDGVVVSVEAKSGKEEVKLKATGAIYQPLVDILRNEIGGKKPFVQQNEQGQYELYIQGKSEKEEPIKIAVADKGNLIELCLPTTQKLLNGQLDFAPHLKKLTAPCLVNTDDFTLRDAPCLEVCQCPNLKKVGYYFLHKTPNLVASYQRKTHPLKRLKGEVFFHQLRQANVLDLSDIVEIVQYAGWEAEPLIPHLRYMAYKRNALNTTSERRYASQEEAYTATLNLLKQAGYTRVIHPTTLKEQNSIAYLFNEHERLCTFRDSERYKNYFILHCCKENAEKITRSEHPQRQDEYGTSVISIQIKEGFISIKNRYNSTVEGCDSTFDNNPDNIIEGLTQALKEASGCEFIASDIVLPEDVIFLGNRLLRFNVERNNIRVGENFYTDNQRVYPIELGTHFVMDGYALNLQAEKQEKGCMPDSLPQQNAIIKKVVNLTDGRGKQDSFCQVIQQEIEGKKLTVTQDKITGKRTLYANGEVIAVTEHGRLVELNLLKTTEIDAYFLEYAPYLRTFTAPKLIKLGAHSLYNVPKLIVFKAPALRFVGELCLAYAKELQVLHAEKVEEFGNGCLLDVKNLPELHLPYLKRAGNNFLRFAKNLHVFEAPEVEKFGAGSLEKVGIKHLNLPNVRIIHNRFLCRAENLISFTAPNLEEAENECCTLLDKVPVLSFPKLKKAGEYFLWQVPSLSSLQAPVLEEVGHFSLLQADKLEILKLPSLKKTGSHFAKKPIRLKRVELDCLEEMGDYCFEILNEITILKFPKLKTVGKKFVSVAPQLKLFQAPELEETGDYSLSELKSAITVYVPKLKKGMKQFAMIAPRLRFLNVNNMQEMQDNSLVALNEITSLVFSKLKKVGPNCLMYCPKLAYLSAPMIEAVSSDSFNNLLQYRTKTNCLSKQCFLRLKQNSFPAQRNMQALAKRLIQNARNWREYI